MSQATNDQYQKGQDGRRRSQWSIDSLLDNEPASGRPLVYNQQQSPGLDRTDTAYDSVTTISTPYGQIPHHFAGHELQHDAGTKVHLPAYAEQAQRSTSFATTSSTAQPSVMRKVRRAWNYGWTAEIFSCALAMVSLASIVITLCLHEGKPLPKWPLGITINALIAVLTVLMKAGLSIPLSEGIGQLKWQWFEERPRKLIDIDDYDTASRGPWGSFLFLFTGYDRGPSPSYQVPDDSWPSEKVSSDGRKGNWTGYLAKFAAFITVLTVAIDPFAQQIIAYVDCPGVSASFQSSIARTNRYNVTGGHTGAGESDIDGPMAVAINRGVIDPPEHIPSLVSTNCKSGNCTFPNFSTVGLCHACEDLSSQIHNITSKQGPWNFTLPGDDNFDSLYLYYQYVFKTQAVIPIGNNIMDLRTMGESTGTGTAFRISAFHCSLAPCVRTYSAYMTDGTLEETLLSTAKMGQNQDLEGGTSFYRLVTSQTLRDGQEEACVPSDKEGPGLVKVAKTNIDAAPDHYSSDPADTAWYPEECVWSFDLGSRYAILQELGQQLGDLDMERTSGVAVGAIAAKNLWRNGTADLASMSLYFDELAEVMTATIRNRGAGGAAEYAQGQVLVNETCVAVRWAWLSYPTALAVLAAVFLAAIFAQSPREPSLRVWKSSALPLLFSSVDEAKYDVNYYGMTKNHMNHFAEMVWVQLRRDEEGRAKFS